MSFPMRIAICISSSISSTTGSHSITSQGSTQYKLYGLILTKCLRLRLVKMWCSSITHYLILDRKLKESRYRIQSRQCSVRWSWRQYRPTCLPRENWKTNQMAFASYKLCSDGSYSEIWKVIIKIVKNSNLICVHNRYSFGTVIEKTEITYFNYIYLGDGNTDT